MRVVTSGLVISALNFYVLPRTEKAWSKILSRKVLGMIRVGSGQLAWVCTKREMSNSPTEINFIIINGL